MCENCKTERIRWTVYNVAFWLFGKTRVWPRLGELIWRG